MLTPHRRTAVLESLMLQCEGVTPTERHYRAVAEAHGVSARTVRRAMAAMFDLPATSSVGMSAQAALDSLVALDPRVVFAEEPQGPGWWPDLHVLEVLAAHPTVTSRRVV